MIYEICASSFESAKNAEISGATRIELCSELGVGGVTPSYGLIKKVMDELSIGNCVLIRPRSGNFTYTDEEFDVMLRDINLCRELGCQGVVTEYYIAITQLMKNVLHASKKLQVLWNLSIIVLLIVPPIPLLQLKP